MPLARVLIAIGSGASIGFGIWHVFVPRVWNWYSYVDASATELILSFVLVLACYPIVLALVALHGIPGRRMPGA